MSDLRLVYFTDSNQLTITGNAVPQDNPEGKKRKKKEKEITNCLCEILNELLNEAKVNLAHVVRETRIAFTTLDDWANARSIPLADENLFKLARYFNVTVEYLCWGAGKRKHNLIHDKLLDFYYTVTEMNPEIKKLFKEHVMIIEEEEAA